MSTLLNDLLMHVPFSEGTGGTAADAVGSNDITISDPEWQSESKIGSNSIGIDPSTSTHPNGTSGSVPGLLSGSTFTMSFWVYYIKTTQSIARQSITAHTDTSGSTRGGYYFNIRDETDDVRVALGGITDTFPNSKLTENDWNLVIFKFNNATGRLTVKVNNVQVIDFATSFPAFSTDSSQFFSFSDSNTQRMTSYIQHFAVWDRPLTTEEDAELWNSGDGVNLQSLAGGDPTVTTQAVTNIDKTTATANGNVTDLGEEASVEAGHQFRIKNVETPNAWTNTTTQSLSATGAYTTSLTALDPDTTYEVRSRITWDAGAEEAFGSIEEFTTDPLDAPTVTTQAATSIGTGGATLNGNVTSKGDFDPVDARFQYRETGSGTWLETSLSENVATGAYTFGLTGLTPETEYEFRAKVEYGDDQEVFGDTLTFTTLEGGSAPSVTTNAMTEIRATLATANGDVTSDGGETVTERGFVWATTTAPDVTDNKVEVAGTTGAYSVKLTALPPETLIYVRTYAINSEGTSYGNEVEFTTLSLEDVRNPVYIKDGDNLRRI